MLLVGFEVQQELKARMASAVLRLLAAGSVHDAFTVTTSVSVRQRANQSEALRTLQRSTTTMDQNPVDPLGPVPLG